MLELSIIHPIRWSGYSRGSQSRFGRICECDFHGVAAEIWWGLASCAGKPVRSLLSVRLTYLRFSQITLDNIKIGTRLVAFLSGVAHITLPNSTDDVWITGGKFGVIVVADRNGSDGHISQYPSAEDTVALQVSWSHLRVRKWVLTERKIPFKDGVVPEHRVLRNKPCRWEEMIGI